jgi:pentatricopeptide repeat protein
VLRCVEILGARLLNMSAEKILPNTFTFNSAISACEKCGEWQQALSLLQDMVA